MIPLLLAALQAGGVPVAQPFAPSPPPRITLAAALREGARLDPGYVAALGGVSEAGWARGAALAALLLPALTVSTDYQFFSVEFFNLGIGRPSTRIATARADARFEVFTGGRKLAELSRARAELDGAQANALRARYASALLIEAAYYSVLTTAELLEVARERVGRSEDGLAVARARVTTGAAVPSDSLQLLLERTEAQVNLIRAEAALRAAQLDLGRRVGRPGPVDAEPLDSLPPPPLPLELGEAVTLALDQGPAWRLARADERAAGAALRARRAAYFPTLTATANQSVFDDSWPPSGLTRRTFALSLNFPIWDNGQRELALSRAKTQRDVARAIREDLERAAAVDVTTAWDAYGTAAASYHLDQTAVAVARENFRVQDQRYRAGATTILDLLEAQDRVTQAEADLVQARYGARFALAGLEAILGRRLFHDEDLP